MSRNVSILTVACSQSLVWQHIHSRELEKGDFIKATHSAESARLCRFKLLSFVSTMTGQI